MPLVPQCNICKMIKAEILKDGTSKLQRRLDNCKKFNPGGETQESICKDLGVQRVSLSKHLKYHQNPDATKLANDLFEKQEKKTHYSTVQETILEKGMEGIESGEIKLNSNTIASVARDKMNQEERNKDRSLKVMELIFAYQSGELLDDPTSRAIEGSAEVIQN